MESRCEVHKKYRGIGKPRGKCKACWAIYQEHHRVTEEIINADLTVKQATEDVKSLRRKYKVVLDRNKALQTQLDDFLTIKNSTIKPTIVKAVCSPKTASEAVPIILASDWHWEEEVKPETVNGLNAFNLKIARQRAEYFFQNALTMVKLSQQAVNINTIVLALLGDFVSNSIHDELLEANQLRPMDAILEVQDVLVGGIEFLLKNTNCRLIIPCHSGNHARITAKTHHSTEAGNSLEYAMYRNLAWRFQGNDQVEFIVSPGYHSYLTIFGMVLRFHHGHGIQYHGGVGGIYIPLNKAIQAWNGSIKADIDVLGHWHQRRDGGRFVCNGSLIGYNAYALRIKADYEIPQQGFFLIDKSRRKTIVAPILVDRH